MGWLSSICSCIGGAISSAVNSIGSALSSFATSVGGVLGTIVTALAPVAEALGQFANTFLRGAGLLKPDEDIKDMGERALQAAGQGITIEQFENFESYMDSLREFKVDPDVSAKRSAGEKLVAGLGIGTVAVENKYSVERGSLNGLWLLPMANSEYFNPERMQQIVATGRLCGGDVIAYLEKQLSGADNTSFEASLSTTMDKEEKNTLYSALDQAVSNMEHIRQQMQDCSGRNT